MIGRAALRLNLHVPGHSAVVLGFFLLLARACVPRFGAATLAGGIAGLLVDLGAALVPGFASRPLVCAAIGAVAGSTRGLVFAPLELVLGVTPDLVLAHAATSTLGGAAFGALGGALVPPLYRRLAAHQLLPEAQASAPADATRS